MSGWPKPRRSWLCRQAERTDGYWLSPHEAGLPDTVSSVIFHETTAIASTCYEPQVVPGLLQTEQVPAQFTFMISEHALRSTVGGPAIMQEQLLALTLIGALPQVTIRVVPESAVFGGAFRLFTFAGHRPLVYLDAYVGGLFLEDKEYVDVYRQLIPEIAHVALNEGQSWEFIANLANDHDRGSTGVRVEEEQLQR